MSKTFKITVQEGKTRVVHATGIVSANVAMIILAKLRPAQMGRVEAE